MTKWIDILSDGDPDREVLKGRLQWTFGGFLIFVSIGLFVHVYWALHSNNAANFSRGGAWVIAVSVISLGMNLHFLSVERWRLDHLLGRQQETLSDQFLYRHFIETSGRFFNGINLGSAAIGALISGYGDIWFERAFL